MAFARRSKRSGDSRIALAWVRVKDGDINPWDTSVAAIRVIHDLDTLPATYYGALLESAATLQGASLMSFVTKNKKGDYVTMPKAQWFVGSATAGTKVLK